MDTVEEEERTAKSPKSPQSDVKSTGAKSEKSGGKHTSIMQKSLDTKLYNEYKEKKQKLETLQIQKKE